MNDKQKPPEEEEGPSPHERQKFDWATAAEHLEVIPPSPEDEALSQEKAPNDRDRASN